jgi:fatty-acyl-CoA synthase
MTGNSAYLTGLDRNQANYTPLTPLTFLERAAYVYPDRPSVVHGAQRFTWRETYVRCRRLASALARRGVGKNDTVALMAPNIPAMYEAHFGVPMCGAVLNTLNTRLDAETIAFMLRHGGARVLITDREFSATIEPALALLDQRPLVIDIDDPSYQGGNTLGETGYEAFLAEGDPDYAWQGPAD